MSEAQAFAIEDRAATFIDLPQHEQGGSSGEAVETGHRLSQARQQLGLSREDAAQRLHLPLRVIEQLESGRWDGISTPIYLRGYLRSYGQLLGMGEPALPDAVQQRAVQPMALVSTGGISHGRYLLQRYATAATYLVITALIVVPVIVLGLNGGLRGTVTRLAPLESVPPVVAANPDTPNPQAHDSQASADGQQSAPPLMASLTPLPLPEAKPIQQAPPVADVMPEVAKANGKQLVIDLSAPSWVEVLTSQGQRLEYALLPAGKHVYAQTGPLTVRIGNVDVATVARGGTTLDLHAVARANVAYFQVDAHGKLKTPPDA